MKECDYCICKTCAIAYTNGGAPGCGDCERCKSNAYNEKCNNCYEYYCPDKREEK